MGPNYIALAIPIFVVSIVAEILIARAQAPHRRMRGGNPPDRTVHRFADVVANLSCGMFQQVGLVFLNFLLVAAYAWVYQRDRLFDLSPSSVAPWLIAFVGVDFFYYWWHRLSHEVNFLWAAHVVHHQSEDYNLAVALRQSLVADFTALPFYLPLALLGVPPIVFVTVHSFSILYQFWIHTELVGTLGPVDKVLNTPSNHRVHHAINPRYLDKNYAAILMIWDQLFGTFRPEDERPIYGITNPLASFNVLWAQTHYWFEMARDAWRAPRFADKFLIWFASPAWHPRGLEKPPAPAVQIKFDVPVTPRKGWTIGAIQLAAVIGTFLLLQYATDLDLAQRTALGGAVFLALLTGAALLANRSPVASPVTSARG